MAFQFVADQRRKQRTESIIMLCSPQNNFQIKSKSHQNPLETFLYQDWFFPSKNNVGKCVRCAKRCCWKIMVERRFPDLSAVCASERRRCFSTMMYDSKCNDRPWEILLKFAMNQKVVGENLLVAANKGYLFLTDSTENEVMNER